MATLKDVAKLACVDVSTVSRALNNASNVHPDTKAKIVEAAKQLGYRPNLLAKGLRQGKLHTIGIVVPSIKLNIFGEIVQGIDIEARSFGYGVMICNTKDDPEQEVECLSRLCNGFVDGVIIASTGRNTSLIRNIKEGGISVVQIIRAQDKTISSVVADYRHCAVEGVNHLIAKGCRQIGFINGNMEITPYKERYKGYKEAVEAAGLPEILAKSKVPRYDYYRDGYDGTNSMLEGNPGIDGIITAVDMQGLGAIRALKERRIRVPDDMKVISLTGHSIGGMLETSMSSIEMPAKAIGKKATQMIIKDIESPSDRKAVLQHIVFATSIMERETT